MDESLEIPLADVIRMRDEATGSKSNKEKVNVIKDWKGKAKMKVREESLAEGDEPKQRARGKASTRKLASQPDEAEEDVEREESLRPKKKQRKVERDEETVAQTKNGAKRSRAQSSDVDVKVAGSREERESDWEDEADQSLPKKKGRGRPKKVDVVVREAKKPTSRKKMKDAVVEDGESEEERPASCVLFSDFLVETSQ